MFEMIEKAYSILGISKQCTQREIKNKYRKLVIQYHPDSYKGKNIEEAIRMIQEINWAYEVVSKEENLLFSKMYSPTDKYEGDSSLQNKEAFYNRNSKYEGEGFYCWDPEKEEFLNFAGSIANATENIMKEVVKKIWDDEIPRYHKRSIDFISKPFFEKIFYLLQQEYVKPYFCLCKLIEFSGSDCKQIVSDNVSIDKYDRDMTPFKHATVSILLQRPSVGSRTENIEKMKIGDEVQICCILNHPIYPNTIEIFNFEGGSLGDIPPEYSVCLSPLIQRDIVDVSAKVSSVETREMRGGKARTASLTIDLTMQLKEEIIDEKPINVNGEIQKWIDSYTEYVKVAYETEKMFEREDLNSLFLEKYVKDKNKEKFDKVVFGMRGNFGQTPNNSISGYGITSIDNLEDIPKEQLQFVLLTITALNNRRFIADLIEKGMKNLLCIRGDYLYKIKLSQKKSRNGFVLETIHFIVYKNMLMLDEE